MASAFTKDVVQLIASIPPGKVASYGQIAALAGNPRAARQVARILHTQSRKHHLSWHRVVSSKGKIALRDPLGAEEQSLRLEAEGVSFLPDGTIPSSHFWQPDPADL